MEHKRLTLFAGHYGSGKTNIAVNYALLLAAEGKPVAIADLDIVNPYFRTKDSAAELNAAGIHLISPQFANTNVDLPALPAEAYRLVEDKKTFAVMDIGGDDRGAYALGRYTPFILEENNYRMAFVANPCRPLTRTRGSTGGHAGDRGRLLPALYLHREQCKPRHGDHGRDRTGSDPLYAETQRAERPSPLADRRGKGRGSAAGRQPCPAAAPDPAEEIL